MRVNYVVCMLSHAVWLCNINLQLFLFSRFCPNFPVISLYIIHNGCISSTHMHAHVFYFRYRLYTFFHFIFLYLRKKARHVTGVLSWFYMISVAYLIIFSSYSLVPRPIFSARKSPGGSEDGRSGVPPHPSLPPGHPLPVRDRKSVV